MKTVNTIILSAILILSACKQSKTAQQASTANEKPAIKSIETPSPAPVEVVEGNTEKPKSNDQGIKGLVVSFYSMGGGIDLDAARKFDTWISGYKTQSGKSVAFEKIGWGREGEVDFCVQLESINQAEAQQFVDEAKGNVSQCKLMHFSVNGVCKRKRN
jgi:hypothetical protein